MLPTDAIVCVNCLVKWRELCGKKILHPYRYTCMSKKSTDLPNFGPCSGAETQLIRQAATLSCPKSLVSAVRGPVGSKKEAREVDERVGKVA